MYGGRELTHDFFPMPFFVYLIFTFLIFIYFFFLLVFSLIFFIFIIFIFILFLCFTSFHFISFHVHFFSFHFLLLFETKSNEMKIKSKQNQMITTWLRADIAPKINHDGQERYTHEGNFSETKNFHFSHPSNERRHGEEHFYIRNYLLEMTPSQGKMRLKSALQNLTFYWQKLYEKVIHEIVARISRARFRIITHSYAVSVSRKNHFM